MMFPVVEIDKINPSKDEFMSYVPENDEERRIYKNIKHDFNYLLLYNKLFITKVQLFTMSHDFFGRLSSVLLYHTALT